MTEQLQRAIIDVVSGYSSPYAKADGSVAAGRAFRLAIGRYSIPPAAKRRTCDLETGKFMARSELEARAIVAAAARIPASTPAS